MDIDKGEYISANASPGLRSLLASFNGLPIDTAPDDLVTFTLSWTGVAATDGDFAIEVSDDPLAMITPGSAVWNAITFPSGSTDGTQVSVAAKVATINANAGKLRIALTGLQGALRLTYTRRGGGGATQLLVYYSKKRRRGS